MATVMRYMKSSQSGTGPLIARQEELGSMVVTREAALPVEFGVTGRELMTTLRRGCEKFIKAMELQGLTLIPLPEGNPLCVTNMDDTPHATFSITKDLEKNSPDEYKDHETGGQGPETLKNPNSLDMSDGMVDYRFVAVFWAPKVSIEIAKSLDRIHAEEKLAMHPNVWGAGKTTPTKPSIAIARD